MTDNTKRNNPRRNQKTSKETLQSAVAQPSTLVAARGSSKGEIERLNYFTGQFLEATDFKDEQEYHIRMRRFGNRALYSAGILDSGFEVQKISDSEISISSGIGIDAQGRELIIITPLKVGVPIDKKSMTLNITLEYVEKEAETSSDTFVDTEGISVTGRTRIAETPAVEFPEDANITNNQIRIAKITLDANGKIGSIDKAERQFAHARFLGVVGIGQKKAPEDWYRQRAGLEINKGDTNEVALLLSSSGLGWGSGIQFKNTAANGKTYGIYSDSITGSLHITDEDLKTDRLVIDKNGNVGLGTHNPVAKLQVTGGAIMPAAGNDDASGILFPENPGTGSGDKAWIRYYARDGEKTALEIGVADNSLGTLQDDILLIPSGGVGIGTREPKAMLDVEGGAFLGYESTQSNFNAPLKSGFYQGHGNPQGPEPDTQGDVPDTSHDWSHLIVSRHSNTTNNHQFQIASTYLSNDRIFFRKIADNSPNWNEIATRGVNNFLGNQFIRGSLSVEGEVYIRDHLYINGKIAISSANSANSLVLNFGNIFGNGVSCSGLFEPSSLNVGSYMTSTGKLNPGIGNAYFKGKVMAVELSTTFSDLAENFFSDTMLDPGDVVCFDPIEDRIVKSENPESTMVCGIISTAPGVLLNSDHGTEKEGNFPLALSGRVPCKVTDENGPIKRGDLLCTSSKSGHAMKAQPVVMSDVALYRPSTILGKALGSLESGSGIIDVLVFLS
ncbi:MAG TPA: hypothetical protein PKD88_10365 [Nitrosomonas sp.]|nr:hypothetical protein [Nitrosomonas sp.]HMW21399.1 hypothetical protein [Nitrosomonas sp.]HMW69270.1 hypothetical protein [Nitrosomonas sp.]HMY62351.1 hypothetical protein [Nitrosomonas sp.]HMY90922.1 hypothetical protein [Nitrosomonas sp.]